MHAVEFAVSKAIRMTPFMCISNVFAKSRDGEQPEPNGNLSTKKTSPAMRTRLCEIFEQAELTGSVALRFSLYHHENQGLPTVRMGWAYQACCSS